MCSIPILKRFIRREVRGEQVSNKFKKSRLYLSAIGYNLSMIMALLPAILLTPLLIALLKNPLFPQILISMPIIEIEYLIIGSTINAFAFAYIGFYFYSIMKKEMSK